MKGLRAKFNSLSLSDLGSGLRALQVASAQRVVLDSLSVSLVLFDDVLINTSNGEYRQLEQGAEESPCMPIARAARALLHPGQRVLLLLPPAHFVATPYSLNINNEKLLRSALSFQAHTLIPAYETKLMLAMAGNQGQGVALWYPEPAANTLFEAFHEQGLLLGAVMPRALARLDTSTETGSASQLVRDNDSSHHCALLFEGGIIKRLLTVSKQDLDQDVFTQQWQHALVEMPAATEVKSSHLEDWTGLRRQIGVVRGYAFIPQRAESSGSQGIRKQQQKWGAIAATILVFVLCLPFISNAVQKALLESQLEQVQSASAGARESQASVIERDTVWGAVAQYPQQDVGQVLLSLNSFIDNALSSFTINKGVVDISGFAQDPALLIEQLSEREEFFDVGQSRSSSAGNTASRGDRFGIRLNVSDVDYPAYEAQYPAVQ